MQTTDPKVPVILIVDDNHNNLQVLGKLLLEEKYEVEFAVNGESALEWVYNKSFDLILLDINMPGMNGFDVCKKIRSDPKMNAISIIFLSAESERESILKGFEMGGQDYITKPFDSRELIVRAKNHITLKRSIEKFEKLSQVLEEKVIERTHELKMANSELIVAKNRAEESDRLKTAFLANMSHEIRTPMNGILGFSELLKEADLTGEEQKMYIAIIEKSGTRMLNIIDQIVDISKIESGTVQITLKESDINESCKYAYNFFKPEAESKSLKLNFINLFPNQEVLIRTDHVKVCSILANLIKNAIKYTEKGSIEFGYDVVKTDDHLSLQFFVTDTGIGIPKDRQQAIYDRFIQADISDSKAYQGAGLGLSIAKAYVEILGGRIWVESEVGKGSTFYFTLPNDENNLNKQ
ncbi:MAG: hypothetical protein A2X22_02400 [Bacteroidetes bacterium GWF2_49_14]|nr:MAG: hypothetical protein A2X22_02400 [Bacteroidetes bacterium GWF2_49_14]